MQILLILNDPPYGTERCYNGLRLALALPKSHPAITVTVFLMADAVTAAKSGQKTPDGYYNVERMLKGVVAGKGQILLCGTCMDARGLADTEILTGARRSTMAELAAMTISAEKVLVF
ncbi:MAG: DsrE family protein [Bradyrhizobium sp.]|nr:DsrE family protein [Pseudomonadota bacterium]MDE2469572.1 DsrE family protein [Bradyrhizobium sp.]